MKALFKILLNAIPRPWLISLSYYLRPVLSMAYRGHRFTDPIDGKNYRTFLPYGYANVRPNVLSPGTLSLERHRLCWLYLKNKTSFFSQTSRVLHFAPEQAFYHRFKVLPNLSYTTTDLNSPLADVTADITDLPFTNDSFEVIICNHVLEHIPNDLDALRELYRVLAPNGMAILQVPYDPSRRETFQDDRITDRKERTKIFGQYDHVRVYGMDYFDRVRSVGFEVKAIDLTAEMSAQEVDRYRLAPGELIPVAYKLLT